MADHMTLDELRAVAKASRVVLKAAGDVRLYRATLTPTQSIAQLAEQIGELKAALRALLAAVDMLDAPEADR